MGTLLLLLLFTPKGPHWIKVKDGYRIHLVYVTQYGNEIGNYYQPYKQSGQDKQTGQDKQIGQANAATNPFTAQCWEGKPVEFASEQEAKEYVLHCPE
jgi:hypothetical protein